MRKHLTGNKSPVHFPFPDVCVFKNFEKGDSTEKMRKKVISFRLYL